VAADVLSFLVLALVWYRISGKTTSKETIAWMDLGVVALIVSGGAHALWLARGRSRLRAGRRVIIDAVAPEDLAVLAKDRRALRAAMRGVGPREVKTLTGATDLVIVSGTGRLHRSGCAFAANRSTQPVAPGSADARDLEPCEVCRP
jgi:hypothetical protein